MYNRIELDEAWKQLLAYDPAVWAGVFTLIIVFIVEIILYKKGIIFSRNEKRIAKAKASGNVISAKQVKCRYYDKAQKERQYVANYQYEFNGLHTKTVVTSNSLPPTKITLYYDGNKVFSEFDIGFNLSKILIYIIPILSAVGVAMALGFRG